MSKEGHIKKWQAFFLQLGDICKFYTIFMLFSFIPNKFTLERIIVNSLLNIDFSVHKKRINYNDNIQHISLFCDNNKNNQTNKFVNNKFETPNMNFIK